MDQGESVRATAAAPINLEDEDKGNDKPTCTRSLDRTVPAFTSSGNGETRSTANTLPRTRTANLVKC